MKAAQLAKLAILSGIALSSVLHSGTVSNFTVTGTGNLGTTTNWSTGSATTASTDAVILAAATQGQISTAATISVGSLNFLVDPTTSFNIQGNGAGSTLKLGNSTTANVNSVSPNGADLIYLGPNTTKGATIQGTLTIQLQQSGNFDIQGTGSLTIGTGTTGVTITGSSYSITKTGSGTLIYNGTQNTYGDTIIANGTLALEMRSASANTNFLNTSSGLTLGGGTLQIKSGTGTAYSASQTVNGLTLASGYSVIDLKTYGTNTSANAFLSVGAINRQSGSVLNLTPNANTTLNTTTNGVVTSTANNASGILGGYFIVNGADWAANSVSSGGGYIAAYTGYTDRTTGTTISSNANSNIRVTSGSGSVTMAAGGVTDIANLLVNDTSAVTVDIGSGNTLRLSSTGGILQASGAGALTIGATKNVGTLSAGGADNTAGELIISSYSINSMTLNSVIADNGTGAVTVTYSRLSGGSTSIQSTNTYTGNTYINKGTVYFDSGTNSGSGNAALGAGTTVYMNGGTLQGYSNVTLSTAAGTARNVVLSDAGGTLTSGSGGTFKVNGIISGTGKLTVTTGGGGGTVVLTGANTYSGGTTLSSGTLTLGNSISGDSDTLANAKGLLLIAGGTLSSNTYDGNANIGSDVTMTSGSITAYGGGVGTITLTSGSYVMSGGTLVITVLGTSVYDKIIGNGSNSFTLTGGIIDLGNGSGINYTSTYNIFTNFASGSVSGITITNYDSANWTASLSNSGVLSFAAIPEPSSMIFILGGTMMLAGSALVRRRKTCNASS